MTQTHGFRRIVAVSKIGEAGLEQKVEAATAELAGVAAYLDLSALNSFGGTFSLLRWRGKGVRVTGTLSADVVQTCVVTLEPVEARVEATFERRFLPPEKLDAEDDGEIIVDPMGEDPPERLGHELDLGEILVEELALNLDPYPRKPGVAFDEGSEAPARENPFAVLAQLKPKT